MRKIEFRGKRIDNGEWVYGVPFEDFDGNMLIGNYGSKVKVIPDTVSEFTGLEDKNGTRIFEGDIVKYVFPVDNAKPNIGEVKFSECDINSDNYNCGFFIKWENSYLPKEIGYWTNYRKNKIEVIGNIHDNPELLKEVRVYEIR